MKPSGGVVLDPSILDPDVIDWSEDWSFHRALKTVFLGRKCEDVSTPECV